MAEPLTSTNEPGFFSRVSESPSLFLTPDSEQPVGLIGEGKSTKTITESLTRGTGNHDALANPISSFNLASSNAVFRYPQSSFAAAHVGTVDLTTLTYPGGLDTLTLITQVDGEAAETVTFATPANAAAVVTQFNAAMSDVSAELTSDNKLLIWVSDTALAGKSFVMGAGTANTPIGFVAAARAKSLRWDPAVTDSEFAPQDPEEYQLEYETPKVAADFGPKQFFGLSQVVAEYGPVSAANTLSLGAQGAFGNGASIVTCRQLDPAEMTAALDANAEIKAALSDLEDYAISILVPMVALNAEISASPIGIDSEYLDHVSKMSSKLERKERLCILGMDEKAGRLDILGAGSWEEFMEGLQPALSSGLSPKRVMVVNPGRCLTSSRGTAIETDGTYAAACLAGRMVSSEFDEAEPMTRKTLSTIDELILPELSRPEKNQLTGLGVTVIEPKSSLMTVRRAVTADGSSITSQEPSIVRAFDRVSMELRDALENRFVGTKILNTTGTALEAATSVFLERLVAEEIISSYRNVKATQNPQEPRQFDITFEAVPVYPFIWGFLDVSIVLS